MAQHRAPCATLRGRGVRSSFREMLGGAGPRVRCVSVIAAALLVAFAAAGAISALARGAGAESESKVRVAFVGGSLSDRYWEGGSVTAGRDPCLKNQLEVGRVAK